MDSFLLLCCSYVLLALIFGYGSSIIANEGHRIWVYWPLAATCSPLSLPLHYRAIFLIIINNPPYVCRGAETGGGEGEGQGNQHQQQQQQERGIVLLHKRQFVCVKEQQLAAG